jgi:segregation and condensation protein B
VTGLARTIEALLFLSGEPVTAADLADAIGVSEPDVAEALGELRHHLAGRGVVLRELAGGWALASHPDAEEAARRLLARPRTGALTPAQAETLAVVAYLQPVSRPEIARIRGVNVDGVVAGLAERGLIAEGGRDDEFGAIRYRTTPLFERVFGLESLAALPRVDDLGADVDEIRGRLEAVAEKRPA